MSKQLYEEALADVKKVKEVAEANAQRAILDAVTPRIRELIERELLNERYDDEDEAPPAPGSVAPEGELLTDLNASSPSGVSVPAVVSPDEDGKVTLDLDALCPGEPVPPPAFGKPLPAEYEVSMESVASLQPLLNAARASVETRIQRLGEAVARLKANPESHEKITQMISHVENMYDYVQESVADPVQKSSYEEKLEAYFGDLNQLREQEMSNHDAKDQMNEADVTLKLTGLPDDIDLDAVGVDLITGDDEEAGDEGGDVAGDEGDEEMDFGDLGLGDEGGEEEEIPEGLQLSDDTIVEIDENMLRREIARMKKLREEAAPSTDGNGVSAKELDDFGGGEGDPLDADMPHKSPAPAALPLGEADEDDLEEMDLMDEDDGMAIQAYESLHRRLSFEKRLQERAKRRAATLKKEVARARSQADARRVSSLKKEYNAIAKRFNESVERSKKFSGQLAEARLHQRSRSNSGSTQPAEPKAVESLRTKLAETNLINAKLVYTNKLLQNEQLTARQKAQVIEQLDATKTVREAKLVYDSLCKTLVGVSKSVTEGRDRRVLGSASRATRPALTQTLNEGWEAERWAKLAGIVK